METWSLLSPSSNKSVINQENHTNRWDFTFPSFILYHVTVKSICFCEGSIMPFLGLFQLSLPFQNAASYGPNRWSMIFASRIASICFQIWSVTKPGSPVLGVAFLFMPHRIRMSKVLYPEQSNSLYKGMNHYPSFSILFIKFMFVFDKRVLWTTVKCLWVVATELSTAKNLVTATPGVLMR